MEKPSFKDQVRQVVRPKPGAAIAEKGHALPSYKDQVRSVPESLRQDLVVASSSPQTTRSDPPVTTTPVTARLVPDRDETVLAVEANLVTGWFTDRKHRNFVMGGIVILIVVVTIVLVVAFTVEGNPAPVGATPTPSPTSPTNTTAPPTPTSRLDAFQELLFGVSSSADWQNTSSPQWKALQWLANEDEAELQPEDPALFDTIRDRYIMALFYFATNGDGWFYRLGFLTSVPVCNWNDGNPGIGFDGVECDANSSVTEITIRKWL